MQTSTIVIASDLEWNALPTVHGFDHVITGVGMPAVYRTFLKRTASGPLISIGIAGAYEGTGLRIGDVVFVESEIVGDLGMELPEHPGFTPLRDFPFGRSHSIAKLRVPDIQGIPVVNGCSVSTVTGTERTGIRNRDLYGASVETMEGYAVADVAATSGVPCVEIRAISNFASRRDMKPENIRLALDSLNAFWEIHGSGIVEALHET